MVRLRRDTTQLQEDQSVEMTGQVMRAFISILCGTDGRFNFTRSVLLKDVADSVSKVEQKVVKSHQVGEILRDLNFQTKERRGYTTVVNISPATLIAACDEVGYKGEEIAQLRNEVEQRRAGNNNG